MDGVAIASLEPGTTVVVNTWNSQYRLLVLCDPCIVVVKGGKIFTEASLARFAGATAGSSVLKVGWVLVGCEMEIWQGLSRIRSSPVRSISIEAF